MTKPLKHIAVNTRLLLPGGVEGIGRFSVEILRRLTAAHPETKFSFFFDRPFDKRYLFGPNVEAHVLFPQARHPFLFIWWFERSVTRKLRALKPDVFFSPDGYLSTRTNVPQVPVFHDLAFEHFPEDVKRLEAWHYRKYFPRFARKAKQILTVSDYTRRDIVRRYGVKEEKIHLVHNAAADHFRPLSQADREAARRQWTEGKPYFLCVGAIQPRKNLARIIQAYDRFRTLSGADMPLVLAGRKAWNFEEVIHTYRESPFKEDIRFTGFVSDEELNQLYNGALALVYTPYFEGFGIPIIEAMECETPVICGNVTSMPEVAGDAALLVDPYDPEAISDAMIRLHAQPALRTALVEKSRQQKTKFTWDDAAEGVWEVLQLANL